MHDADFVVMLHDQLLTISGQRADPTAKVAYHQLEVRYGEFRTEVYLHWSVEQADITAVYQDGFLIITDPTASVQQQYLDRFGELMADLDGGRAR